MPTQLPKRRRAAQNSALDDAVFILLLSVAIVTLYALAKSDLYCAKPLHAGFIPQMETGVIDFDCPI